MKRFLKPIRFFHLIAESVFYYINCLIKSGNENLEK
jgi:hypothetical protein